MDYKIVLEGEKVEATLLGGKTALSVDEMAYTTYHQMLKTLPDTLTTPIFECNKKIEALVQEYGEAGILAIAITGLRLQAGLTYEPN